MADVSVRHPTRRAAVLRNRKQPRLVRQCAFDGLDRALQGLERGQVHLPVHRAGAHHAGNAGAPVLDEQVQKFLGVGDWLASVLGIDPYAGTMMPRQD